MAVNKVVVKFTLEDIRVSCDKAVIVFIVSHGVVVSATGQIGFHLGPFIQIEVALSHFHPFLSLGLITRAKI